MAGLGEWDRGDQLSTDGLVEVVPLVGRGPARVAWEALAPRAEEEGFQRKGGRVGVQAEDAVVLGQGAGSQEASGKEDGLHVVVFGGGSEWTEVAVNRELKKDRSD